MGLGAGLHAGAAGLGGAGAVCGSVAATSAGGAPLRAGGALAAGIRTGGRQPVGIVRQRIGRCRRLGSAPISASTSWRASVSCWSTESSAERIVASVSLPTFSTSLLQLLELALAHGLVELGAKAAAWRLMMPMYLPMVRSNAGRSLGPMTSSATIPRINGC